ncbi:sulfite exporter TauE/SafE family protein [Oxalobacteraceae bacterium]|nr:sulfite exporter TauE/SafE family protein [Oxalobacteraceae bacterium]
MLVLVINLLLGAVLGAFGGMLGIGGGLIAIPVLAYAYGMDQQLAQGTALVMILPNVLIGFLRYRQRNHIDLRALAGLVVVAMVSSFGAARVAAQLDPGHLRMAFALFLLALCAYAAWQLRAGSPAEPKAALPPRYLFLIGLLSGVMSGLFSVGGGLVVVPVLVAWFRMSQTQAQGVGMALVIPGSLVAMVTFAHAGHVHWTTGIPLAIGGIISVSWGVALAHRLAQRTLRTLFCLMLLGTAVASLLQR